MRIFISAHEISPFLGSEARTGWHLINLLSKDHEVIVFAAETNQMKTESYLEHLNRYNELNPSTEKRFKIYFIDQPIITKIIASINKFFFSKLGPIGNPFLYFQGVKFWELKVLFEVKRKILIHGKPDAVHHLNHITFREPGFLWMLPYPFFWGPVSGSLIVKSDALNHRYQLQKLFIKIRNLLNVISMRFNFRVKIASKKAIKIYTVTSEDKIFFQKNTHKIEMLLDVGLNNSINERNKIPSSSKKLKIIWAGRIDAFKSLDTLIHAVNQSEYLQLNTMISVFGDGPNYLEMKKITNDLNITNIHFHGHVDHKSLKDHLLRADLLAHTSIKEASSSVVSEAIESNTPFLSHYAFGLVQFIDKGMGVGIEIKGFQENIENFKLELEAITKDRNILSELSENIVKSKNEFSWDSIASKLSTNYINHRQ